MTIVWDADGALEGDRDIVNQDGAISDRDLGIPRGRCGCVLLDCHVCSFYGSVDCQNSGGRERGGWREEAMRWATAQLCQALPDFGQVAPSSCSCANYAQWTNTTLHTRPKTQVADQLFRKPYMQTLETKLNHQWPPRRSSANFDSCDVTVRLKEAMDEHGD